MELEKEYERLSIRSKLFLRYDRPSSFCVISGVFCFIIGIGFFGGYSGKSDILDFLRSLFGDFYLYVFHGCIFILGLFLLWIGHTLDKKSDPYVLSIEEWLFLDVYSVIENLDVYFKGAMEFHRNKAIRKLQKVAKEISEKWHFGRLKVVRNLVSEYIRSFKRNFEEKLLPSIERGNDEELKKGYDILIDFARFLVDPSPSIADMGQLNEKMLNLTTFPSEKLGFKDRFLRPIKSYPKLQHTMFIMIFATISSFIYFLGVNYLLIPKEYVFPASLGFLGVLLIAYFNYVKK